LAALSVFQLLTRFEGNPPALTRARDRQGDGARAKTPADHLMVVNLSGRGDKDIPQSRKF
jgi:tryptophan synthase beta chain